jgi:poly(ADP-ribose) glycohydrolase ARH3
MADLKEKFLGGMIGSALGDAIGEIAFRYRKKEDLAARLEEAKELIYTDDTAMALGLAESLIERGDLDPQDLGKKFHQNYLNETWRGYGPGPPALFRMVERSKIGYAAAAKSLYRGQGSFGNGAAMRIAPLGIYFHDSPQMVQKAADSAAVTHAHPVGIDGASIQAKAVAMAVNLDPCESFSPEEFVDKLVRIAKTPEMADKLHGVRQVLTETIPPEKAAEFLGRSVAVHESQPFALYCFLRHPRSFKDCLFCAVLNGGDRDTLGAMSCALSGSYLGVDSIPRAWRDKLENRPYIEGLALKLKKKKNHLSTQP